MHRYREFIIPILLLFYFSVDLAFAQSEVIPPTDALVMINGTGGNVTAQTWNGFVELVAGAGISYIFDYNNNEITISSGAGSASLEQLTNVTDDFCTTNQVRKASGNQWICANDNVGAGTLDELTDVILTLANYGDMLYHDGISWVNRQFMINTQTPQADFQIIGINNQTGIITTNQFSINSIITNCSGTDKISSFSMNNVTGTITIACTADSVGDLLTLEQLSNVTDTGCAVGQYLSVQGTTWQCTTLTAGATDIIQEGNSNVEVIDGGTGIVEVDLDGTNEFRFLINLFDVLGATIDNVALIISNVADAADTGFLQLGNTELIAWESNPTGTDLTLGMTAGNNLQISTSISNVDFNSNPLINTVIDDNAAGNSITNIDVTDLDVGTDGELITWDAAGNPTTVAVGTAGQVLTSNGVGSPPTFQDGGSGGCGVLKCFTVKSGWFQPSSAVDDANGGFGGIISDIVSDGTQAFGDDADGTRWATPLTTTAGTDGGVSSANANQFHREWNIDLTARVQYTGTSGSRLFIGFMSTATLPNSNTPCANASCAGFVIDSDDTVCSTVVNDGDASEDRTAYLGCTENTSLHTYRIRSDAASNQFCFTFDSGTEQCTSTEVPAATTDLFMVVEGESAGTNNSIEIYYLYVEKDAP